MNYAVGHNMPGYLPESTVSVVETFEEAKAILIHDLKFQEDYAADESEAEDYCAAAEDVNLWSSPDSIYVGSHPELAWWIMETDEEVDEGDES